MKTGYFDIFSCISNVVSVLQIDRQFFADAQHLATEMDLIMKLLKRGMESKTKLLGF